MRWRVGTGLKLDPELPRATHMCLSLSLKVSCLIVSNPSEMTKSRFYVLSLAFRVPLYNETQDVFWKIQNKTVYCSDYLFQPVISNKNVM